MGISYDGRNLKVVGVRALKLLGSQKSINPHPEWNFIPITLGTNDRGITNLFKILRGLRHVTDAKY